MQHAKTRLFSPFSRLLLTEQKNLVLTCCITNLKLVLQVTESLTCENMNKMSLNRNKHAEIKRPSMFQCIKSAPTQKNKLKLYIHFNKLPKRHNIQKNPGAILVFTSSGRLIFSQGICRKIMQKHNELMSWSVNLQHFVLVLFLLTRITQYEIINISTRVISKLFKLFLH